MKKFTSVYSKHLIGQHNGESDKTKYSTRGKKFY